MYILGKFGAWSRAGKGVFIFDITAIHRSSTQTEWKVNEILYSENMSEFQKNSALNTNWDFNNSVKHQTKNELIEAVFAGNIFE